MAISRIRTPEIRFIREQRVLENCRGEEGANALGCVGLLGS